MCERVGVLLGNSVVKYTLQGKRRKLAEPLRNRTTHSV